LPETGASALVRVPLLRVPGGTAAYAVPGSDGALRRDRKGRAVARKVHLAADGTHPQAVPGQNPGLVTDADWRWITAVPSRHWATVAGQFADRAWATTVALVRAGVLTVDCAVDGLQLGAPAMVRLTSPWVALIEQRSNGRTVDLLNWRERARVLADAIAHIDSGLAAALSAARGHEKTLPVFVAAAEDLLGGIIHDGPRAFSQVHFGDTKAREDTPAILAAAGVSADAIAALGLTRSPYLGLGGAVTITGSSGVPIDLWQFAGPVRLRVDPDSELLRARLKLDDGTITLAIIENLQAAETVCDAYGHLAVAWCAGQPADRPLTLIAGLAKTAGRVLVAPDADWGGVRIADRLVSALPPGVDVQILDAGAAGHETRDSFSATTCEGLHVMELSASDQRVRAFAAAVRERGYPVEQEASVRAVLAAAMRSESHRSATRHS
jgi:Protein of unknown function C-terminus (DUF2399)